MTKSQKKALLKIIISFSLFIIILFLKTDGILKLVLFLIPYLIVGYEVLKRAAVNIFHGQVFDENFLMTIATIGAFCLGEYPEGFAVMLLYQIGELFQDYAVGRSRKSIASLMDIRPDYANIEIDGELKQVDPEEINTGDIIVIKPGEKVPLDGIVTKGSSSLNTSALTGEALPRDVGENDEVISGCININGLLYVRVSKPFGESTAVKILELIENSASKKAKSENFITKFARYYTPAVVISALLLALIPPLFFNQNFSVWIERALLFLVVSCPCALVISVPLSFFSGIGKASKKGILIKGSSYIDILSKTDTIVFDKTGTLTKGNFKVVAIHPDILSKDELLRLAALAESYSNHPISESLREAYKVPVDKSLVQNYEEISGHGINAVIEGKKVSVGNEKMMIKNGIQAKSCHYVGTIIHIAVDGEYQGHIVISDEIKENSQKAISLLKKSGIKTVMLTGDGKATADSIAEKLGIDEVHSQLLPQDKVSEFERLLEQKASHRMLAFVGDGINDAPVLSRADIGIAMGGLGSDAAIEAADIVLMDDDPLKICEAMKISKQIIRIVKQNIIFALSVKFIVLILGALGIANMWLAVFADVGVSIIAIMNSLRLMKKK
ncbi:MAG TPA: heavy metal translocating P-type ATPase [Oscillospiraceae bacterium]|nr:heavy metal translocating P-type ATPase [Oscillospiraceae bacterium]